MSWAEATSAPAGFRVEGGRGRDVARAFGVFLDHLEEFGLAILLAAAAFPSAPPTAAGFFDTGYTNLWSLRIGPANIFELALAVLVASWLIRALVVPPRSTRFDRPLAVLMLCLLALQALALPRSIGQISFLQPDLERVALLVAGYLVGTRCIRDRRALRRFTLLLAGILCLRAAELVLVYGITGETGFYTILGRSALLITEDGLLLMLPVVLAWGAMIDGRLTLRGSVAAVMGTVVVFVVNLLSLRRGAVLTIGAGVVLRSLRVGARRLMLTGGAVVLIVGVLAAAGPGRTLLDQARYTATSSLLQGSDKSSSQHRSELENFGRNVNGFDWIIGRGFGVEWRAEVPSPIDAASFGSKETPITRVGWHIYGLDWAYKIGLLGFALVLATATLLGRRVVHAYRRADGSGRWMIYSLAVCAPPFVLFALTNPRVALMAGVLVGLLSRSCDFSEEAGHRDAGVA